MLVFFLIGFAPLIVFSLACLRYLTRRSASSWHDLDDIARVLRWLAPGLAVLGGVGLAGASDLASVQLALLTVVPLYALITVHHAAWARHYWNQALPATRLRFYTVNYLRSLGATVGITAYLVISALAAEGRYAPEVSVRSYLLLTVASWIGMHVFAISRSTSDHMPGRWQRLAPCEFYDRIADIAARIGTKVDEVRIVSDMPVSWAGGMAYSAGSFALTDELVDKLNKSEADAVVAHELGHLTRSQYWWLYWPVLFAAWLAWIAIAMAAERGMRSVVRGDQLPHYLLWMLLFLVPPLAYRWYVRRGERRANEWLRVLDDTPAAISGYYKLAMVDQVPLDRPWWSRVLSTHPSIQETIDNIARTSGVSSDEVSRIIARADAELAGAPFERCKPVFHEEPDGEIARRPDNRRPGEIAGWIPIPIAVMMLAALALAVAFGDTLGFARGGLLFGALAAALAVAFCLVLSRRRAGRWRQFRRTMRESLSQRYPGQASENMLLLNLVDMAGWDEDKWQCALLGVADCRVVTLGELGKIDLAPEQIIDVRRYQSSESSTTAPIVVSYVVGEATQWVGIRTLGVPGPSEPRNLRALEKHLREDLAQAGAVLPERKSLKRRLRLCAARVPVAIGLAAAILLLMYTVDRCLELRLDWFVYFIGFGMVASSLWSWVAAAGTDGEHRMQARRFGRRKRDR